MSFIDCAKNCMPINWIRLAKSGSVLNLNFDMDIKNIVKKFIKVKMII